MIGRVYLFADQELPLYNAVSNMGTGAALSSFQQLPGAGYYDSYTLSKAPQGIRDVTVSAWIYSATAATRKTALDNLRKYLGVRDRLAIIYDDGTIRWQWARLMDVDAADDVRNVQWTPVDLRFITADQYWRGVVEGTGDWTWQDGTWRWGDGTIVMAQQSTSQTITSTGGTPQTLSAVTNDGNVDTKDLRITITGPTGNGIRTMTVENTTTGNHTKWTYTAAGASTYIDPGEHLVVDSGSLAAYHLEADKSITTPFIAQSGITSTITSTSHGLSTGNLIRVSGSLHNDGYYTLTATTTNTMSYTNRFGRTETTAGMVANKATNVYSAMTIGQRNDWLSLASGSNTVVVTVDSAGSGNDTQDATILFEFSDSYA